MNDREAQKAGIFLKGYFGMKNDDESGGKKKERDDQARERRQRPGLKSSSEKQAR